MGAQKKRLAYSAATGLRRDGAALSGRIKASAGM